MLCSLWLSACVGRALDDGSVRAAITRLGPDHDRLDPRRRRRSPGRRDTRRDGHHRPRRHRRDARHDQRRRSRNVPGHQPGARHLHGARGDAGVHDLRAQGRRRQFERPRLGRLPQAGRRRARGHRDRAGDRLARQHGRDPARRRHHPHADRAGAGARPRRDLADAAAAGRPLHDAGRFDGRLVRRRRPERRRPARRLEQGHHRRRRRQRSRQQRHAGADGQPRCDRRGAAAQQLVSRRVRPVGRLPAPDRHARRHVGLSRQRLLVHPQREPEQRRVLPRPLATARTTSIRSRPSIASTPMAPISAVRCSARSGGSCSSSIRWKRRS